MIYILECVDQTGWKQDLYFDCATANWLHLRIGWDQDPYTGCKNRLRAGSQGDRQKRRRR